MKQTLLDTSFILSCIRNKIDFFEQLELEGIKILVPLQVIRELEGIVKTRLEAQTALKILEKNKTKFKELDLKTKNTDAGIINYARKNKDLIIATLDAEIKNKTKNQKLIIKRKKKLEVV